MELNFFIENLEKKARANMVIEKDDYKKNGLWHCHKCHTPKEGLCVNGSIYPIVCKCRAEEIEQERLDAERKKFEEWVSTSRKRAFPLEKMHQWTFENDDQTNPISVSMKRYADNFAEIRKNQINGLLLYGATGTGKSYLAACIANRLIDKGVAVVMTSFDRIRNELSGRKEDKQDYIDFLARIPLLIIDDLSAESGSDYMQEIVFGVINAREQSGFPLIVTTNISTEELKRPSNSNSNRIYSRILGMCQPIEIKGADRRIKALQQGSRSLKDIMGL